ncbi:MAG TPA: cyclodeaminase/cyclohydrolase family protein [Chloroflexota bacterium]|jgi:formiminotetrahydrofolate cyclodeaminase|nr:cyclodeaminase/cyclohydrolase family protein [Chloroflexota bacterium]
MFAATDPHLAALSVDSWLEALASAQPAPGGGAAAALAAAAGAALIEMVCRFSTGREQFTTWAEQIATTLTMAGQLHQELLATMDADAAAFAAVTAAHSLPRSGKQERALRRQVVDDALAAAAAPPLQVAATAATLAELALALVGRTNAQLVSDLGAAGALLEAAMRIAGYNVEANTRALKADPRAAALHEQLTATRSKAEQHLRELRTSVEQALSGDRLA